MGSDEQLILEFQQGSVEAFTELFERYRDPIFGFFRRRLRDAARAEELAQETFLAVLRSRERYEPRATFRCYLYGIALKLLAGERRRQRSQPQQQDEAADPAIASNPDAGLWVRNAIEQLDEDHREVVLLREFEQLSYSEIAAILRVPINTVRSRLFRARNELKERLAPLRDGARGSQ